MRIILVGAGKGAEILIQHLEKSRHDVILVDKNKDTVESITDRYSVNGVCGSGASREVLLSAGADTADVLISLTPVDEINLLSCSMAKSLGARYAVAQVEREELLCDEAYLMEKFEIDYFVTPKDLTAAAIAGQIYFNAANRVETLFDSNVLLAEITVEKDSLLANARLQDLKPMLQSDFLVFGVLRDDKLMIPKGEFVLHPGDVIGIVADQGEMTRLFSRVALVRKPVRSVMLIGGGELGQALAKRLTAHRISIKLVENNREKCEKLLEEFPKARIIYGSGTDVTLLEREEIGACDVCVCTTSSDETNLLSSLIAWSNGVNNIITTIRTAAYDRVLRNVTINITVSPDRVVAENLLEYLQTIEAGRVRGERSRYYSMGTSMLKISAFTIPEDFPKAGIPLKWNEMRMKKGVLIGAIVRSGMVLIPKGEDVLRCGDRIFVLSESQLDIHKPMDLFV